MPNEIGEINGSIIRQMDGEKVFCFRSGAKVNADGDPEAYHPEKGKGKDYLANAGAPGNWWAIATHNGSSSGRPVTQGKDEPSPGYYVCMTSLCDPAYKDTDQRRYVNSAIVPFIVLPAGKYFGAKLGDLAMVCNIKSGKYCGAVFADTGPRDKIGEVSIALAKELGVNPDPKTGGSDSSDFVYIVFPGSSKGWPISVDQIKAAAGCLFTDWGGFGKLVSFYPSLIKAPNTKEESKAVSDKPVDTTNGELTLKFGRDSFLKKEPSDSSKLADDRKFAVTSGEMYKIKKHLSDVGKHYAVQFYDTGDTIFYVYADHASILNGGEAEPVASAENGSGESSGMAVGGARSIDPNDKKEIQRELSRIGLLDPPIDGKWGSQSGSAARAFNRVVHGDDKGDVLTPEALSALPDFPGFKDLNYTAKKPNDPEHQIALKCIKRMVELGAYIAVSMGSTSPAYNIFHVTGTNPDGTKNSNKINHWNDLRFVVEVSRSGVVDVKLCKVATCEPGQHWISNPMNSGGTFRIAFDKQWFAWTSGRHGSRQYPALCQSGEIEGYRDSNRDGSWSGEKLMSGDYMGVNIHHGYDSEFVGQMSAGCQVAKSIAGHEQFMVLCKSDRRYVCNNAYRFGNISLDGSKI